MTPLIPLDSMVGAFVLVHVLVMEMVRILLERSGG
jgi:hypothetical protein